MKKIDWKLLLKVLVAILTALLGVLGGASCAGLL